MVPGFQSIMLPLLRLAGDGGEHSVSEAEATLGDQFNLSAEDRRLTVTLSESAAHQPILCFCVL